MDHKRSVKTGALQRVSQVLLAALLAVGLFTVGTSVASAAEGDIDPTFNAGGSGFNSRVTTSVQLPDGSMILGGRFTSYNGTPVGRIVKLTPDGAIDTSFNTGTGFDDNVYALAAYPDGRIVVGGVFNDYNGTVVDYLVRLSSTGVLDTGFSSTWGSGFNDVINALAVQTDGSVLAGGDFEVFNGSAAPEGFLRLTSAGAYDTVFNTALGTGFTNTGIFSIAVQPDGKFVLGGNFTDFNNATVAGGLIRLTSAGAVDTAFQTALGTGFDDEVLEVKLLSDGSILAGGGFDYVNNIGAKRVARLAASGAPDTAFATAIGTGFNSDVQSLATQSDGSVLVGGDFTVVNGTPSPKVARLSGAGVLDAAFSAALGTGFSNTVYVVLPQSSGKIVVAGRFPLYNGTAVPNIVRLMFTSQGGGGGGGGGASGGGSTSLADTGAEEAPLALIASATVLFGAVLFGAAVAGRRRSDSVHSQVFRLK